MNSVEINDILNTLNTLYPASFNNTQSERRRNIYINKFTKILGDLTFEDVNKAIDNWLLNDENGKAPTVSVLRARAIKERDRRLHKEGTGTRRIETIDEVMYNIYLTQMSLEPKERNEELIRRCLPSCEIMTNEQAYIKAYGKPRKEYEPF